MTIKTQLIFCLLFLSLTTSCQKKGENCIYLIPENFEGNILIIYDQFDGSNVVYENKSRLYIFDTTGVLKTKFKPNYGLQQNEYFYVNRVGERKIIYYSNYSKLKNSDSVFCYNNETGKQFDTKAGIDKYFETFTIAKEINIDSIGNLRSSFIWKNLNE